MTLWSSHDHATSGSPPQAMERTDRRPKTRKPPAAATVQRESVPPRSASAQAARTSTAPVSGHAVGKKEPSDSLATNTKAAVATEVATQEGVAEYKIELVGHGVGLDIHDIPDYYYDDRPLRANEVFTIEPCLLKPGVAGTRIEDVVVVQDDGCEVLTKAPRGLFAEVVV